MTDLRPWVQHKPECPQSLPSVVLDLGPGWTAQSFTRPCTCGLAAAMTEPEPWNPDLTTAPRDHRIKLQLPPYVTGHLNTVVSVEPIAWAPYEGETT